MKFSWVAANLFSGVFLLYTLRSDMPRPGWFSEGDRYYRTSAAAVGLCCHLVYRKLLTLRFLVKLAVAAVESASTENRGNFILTTVAAESETMVERLPQRHQEALTWDYKLFVAHRPICMQC